MPKLRLDRAAIAKLAQGVPQTIRALEEIFGDVDGTLPSTIEEANALAGQALALVQAQAALLSIMSEALERLDTEPRVHLGTLASQDADHVEITGGNASLASIAVSSTAKVDNLYAARAAQADQASKLTLPTTFPAEATDLPSVIALANALRGAAIAKGL